RLGHTKQAYYITQWYPKPAVFDRTGWHAIPYLTQGEFYSEYGAFDVTITLPKNYVVGATGIQQVESERMWMDSLASVPYSDERKFKAEFQRTALNSFPPSSTEMKTIRYVQDRVHDFGWFADKRFIVRKSAVALPQSGNVVTTWALFTPKNALLWNDAVSYVNESVRLYSKWVGDYPYTDATAVDGTISAGGGMEYPMITVIGNMESKESLDNVIAHEVGHNWFYGILGSNERDHAWMDEGMNSFVELRYMRERYPNGKLSIDIPLLTKAAAKLTDVHRVQSELGYRLNARRNLDQPLSLTSNDFTSINYGTGVYMKTALIMDHLMAYLGEETMDKCLHAYFDQWKFAHPQPWNMQEVFEKESGKDLGWVFGQALSTSQKIEVRASTLKDGALRYRTNSMAPFPITGWANGDSLGTVWTNASDVEWRRPSKVTRPIIDGGFARRTDAARSPCGSGSITLPWPTVDRIRIDANNRTLDIDRRNNTVRAHGLFKRRV
ncbi:MAG TPA: M1 family metallopeptidase, partial [Flavobacteriales bacterium]|nr:M1 family metallopeptidase [Flavobacteriales bacterium]